MNYAEKGVVFTAGVDRLVGVATVPDKPRTTGVLFLVGGPQYRAGSHRQFTLLARKLAAEGYACFRFDFAGMGDSEGARRSFEDTFEDIRSAIVALQVNAPEVTSVVLWGLCDAASAAMLHGARLDAVGGMVLANPWVHGGEYSPGFRLSHYYGPLLRQRAAWRRLFKGQVNLRPALADAVKAITGPRAAGGKAAQHFVSDMLQGIQAFAHPVLVLLSGKDLTAREFGSLLENDEQWQASMREPAARIAPIADSDHTFSRASWREEVAHLTLDYLESLGR